MEETQQKLEIVEIIRINPQVPIPQYATQGSAAFDLYAAIDQEIILHPGTPAVLIPTGIKIHPLTSNLISLILPRSGLGHNKGLVLGNSVGLIDTDYQGELKISAYVHPGYPSFVLRPMERIAQLLFLNVVRPVLKEVLQFTKETERGSGGFGSTGTQVL